MYYLLEDSRIVSSEIDDLVVYSEGQVKLYFEDGIYEDNDKHNNYMYSYFNIINQSENVIDLIDWTNDLIEVLLPLNNTIVLQCKVNKVNFIVGKYKYKHIIAIYGKEIEEHARIRIFRLSN